MNKCGLCAKDLKGNVEIYYPEMTLPDRKILRCQDLFHLSCLKQYFSVTRTLQPTASTSKCPASTNYEKNGLKCPTCRMTVNQIFPYEEGFIFGVTVHYGKCKKGRDDVVHYERGRLIGIRYPHVSSSSSTTTKVNEESLWHRAREDQAGNETDSYSSYNSHSGDDDDIGSDEYHEEDEIFHPLMNQGGVEIAIPMQAVELDEQEEERQDNGDMIDDGGADVNPEGEALVQTAIVVDNQGNEENLGRHRLKCPMCDRAYSRKASLTGHLKLRHGQCPY